MFKDEVEIEVRAGRGGNGAVSMRREKSVPLGGPDGGDGGHGGSVIFVASSQLNSLLPLAGHYHYSAPDGRPGEGQLCSGRSGEDLVIEVPIGTQVFDKKWGNLLRDLSREGMRLQIARGGRGGQGNARFATAVRQTPRFAQNGTSGETRALRLELKLFAEAGLVGLPNAGKSTFLASVTAATPKIADYPFTTLSPQVGIARLAENDTLVLADLPGLIEGAAEGHGLGHRFLRHVERCRVLLHLVDVSDDALEDPDTSRRVIEGELERYSAELAQRPRLLVATKCETPEAHERADALERSAGRKVWRISAVQRRGLPELLRGAWNVVHGAGEVASKLPV
ncbi:MAG: GTPase ObgE [Planctomycetota bacterium]|nr:GTPase ObgE [Planctomycetota bacterium]